MIVQKKGDPYEMLANAVILQAVADFRNAVNAMYRNPRSASAIRQFNDARRFFLRKKDFGVYTSLDGEEILAKLMAEIPETFIELDRKNTEKLERRRKRLALAKKRKENAA